MALLGIAKTWTADVPPVIATQNYLTVQCNGKSATFQGAGGANGDTFRVAMSLASDMSSPFYSAASSASAAGSPPRVTVRGLTVGATYYFKAETGAGAAIADAAVQHYKHGALETETIKIAFPSDCHLNGYKKPNQMADWNCWYMQNNTDNVKSFAFDVWSHYVAGYTDDGDFDDDDGAYLNPTPTDCLGFGIQSNNPDFIHWGGDDVFMKGGGVNPFTTKEQLDTVHSLYARAIAYFNTSQTFQEGNHDTDYLASSGDTPERVARVLKSRQDFLLAPANGVSGRYGYTDIGAVRLIYLTPYPYNSSGDSDPGYNKTLGVVQAAWFAEAVKGDQKINIICMHHVLTSEGPKPVEIIPTGNYYNTFGGVTIGGVDYSELKNNPSEMFDAINGCGKACVLVLAHVHNYAREITNKGVYVFHAPAPYNGREDAYPANVWSPCGFKEEAPHYGGDVPVQGTLFLEINQQLKTVKSYVVKNNGDIATEIPVSTIKLKTGGSLG